MKYIETDEQEYEVQTKAYKINNKTFYQSVVISIGYTYSGISIHESNKDVMVFGTLIEMDKVKNLATLECDNGIEQVSFLSLNLYTPNICKKITNNLYFSNKS